MPNIHAPNMPNMPPMLAFTVKSGIMSNDIPRVYIGQHPTHQINPSNYADDSYWFFFLDASNPKNKVHEVLLPGTSNTTVPSGIQTYMDNPGLLFGVVTQHLSTLHVPQGALYTFLTTYGAGRKLQQLEQLNVTLGCGSFGWVSYALIGQGGPRGGQNIPPPSYDGGSFRHDTILQYSLMPLSNGQPPYSICDCNSF